MPEYKGKVLLFVNTASKCDFTPQYKAWRLLKPDLAGSLNVAEVTPE
ncbi:Glutathione peroxidase [Desulfosporosinus lacus DSM 15449]|uniref:Glutathione peroxidase n=1 Tax=Desulfosporosinus lacus DSM 15449 TaxID=1121420 RepID=A0A1M6HAJ4_9FIRM|nr:Glutathione peroxidase [Desulfosporosinus lacus DSM 15449]